MEKNKKSEFHHSIGIGIGGPDIPENIIRLRHETHLKVHNICPINNKDTREYSCIRSNPKNIIPTNDYFDYKQGLWLKNFSKIEMLDEEVILQILRSLEAVKNVYRKQAGRPIEETNSCNYYQVARQCVIEAIEAQKLIVKRALSFSHYNGH